MTWTNLSFAYGSILTSAKMTQMYDNMATISPRFAESRFGTYYNYQEILATNSAWMPTSGTHSLVVCCIGGGGGGAGLNTAGLSAGGGAGAARWVKVDSANGPYVAIVGSGGPAGGSDGAGTAGGTTSFSNVCSASGGAGGDFVLSGVGAAGNYLHGESGYEKGGAPTVAGAANSGAGGGGGGGAGGTGRILVWEFA